MLVRRRHRRVDPVDLDLVVDAGVFDPVRHLSGVACATALPELVADLGLGPGDTAVDIGTGTGILGIALARLGLRVTATDIDPRATACARRNAVMNLGSDQMRVVTGDLFNPLGVEQFDLVLCNPPYEIGRARRPTLRSPDVLARFGATVFAHTDTVALAFPTDTADDLGVTGLTLGLWRAVPTPGRELGIWIGRRADQRSSAG